MFAASKTAAVSTGGVSYIEDVFGTYLYTGNGATRNITNGIDLSGKGGMTWIKSRSNATNNVVYDTARGANNYLITNSTIAQNGFGSVTDEFTAFNSDGFTLGPDTSAQWANIAGTRTYASWAFREQPKFFDIVTYTGNGVARTIAHNLGSAPGFYVVKRTDTTSNWSCYHRSLGNGGLIDLNSTGDASLGNGRWNSTSPTSTVFSVSDDSSVNGSGGTYVAYLFAHDAGGFGLAGTDNVISCGSFTTNGSGVANVTLGYEPQFVMIKPSSAVGDWVILDTTRGWAVTGGPTQMLKPNSTAAEASLSSEGGPNATGFGVNAIWLSTTCIYVAIRKGPMKVPTSGTSVFGLSARSGTGANATVTGGQLADAIIVKNRGSAVASLTTSRLIGGGTYLITSSTSSETNAGSTVLTFPVFDVMDGYRVGSTSTITNASGNTYINYLFKRAPSFMDVVCYTGTFTVQNISHNLNAVPELIIIKERGGVNNWPVYTTTTGNDKTLRLNSNVAVSGSDSTPWNNTTPTSSVFTVGTSGATNGGNMVAYLFATCAGVSKVGSYTGTGATQTIDCGFTSGARFVLIKRTDSTGDWYVYDTARGMTTLTDPYLLTNSSAAEVATLGSVTTVATGFAVNASILSAINTNAATYIFLAIA